MATVIELGRVSQETLAAQSSLFSGGSVKMAEGTD